MRIQCPQCQSAIEVVADTPREVLCPSCGSSIQLDANATAGWLPLEAPKRLGRFEFMERLGAGAFGTVYKARDVELDRVVAVKVPRTGSVPTQEDLDRFLREARSAARLKHPGIVAVHDAGTSEGTCYLVSEFVQGATLAERLSAGRLSFRKAAELVAEVADALHYAHTHGVVHRDIKPSNIMLDLEQRPHLMDFGLAKRAADDISMTLDGQVLGTPAYMAPEQARGEVRQVDARSDVYGLGVILYELLTGELPFRGAARMLLVQVMTDEPRPPRRLNDAIPRDLETVCLKTMAKEPGRRYQTAAELAEDLRRWLKGEPILARPIGNVERWWRWCRRNPVIAGLTATVATLLVATTIGATLAAVKYGLMAQEEERLKSEALSKADAEAKAVEKLETTLYFHRIALAHREFLETNLDKAVELLDQCVPREGQPDRRAWEWYYLKRLCHVEPVTLRGQLGGMAQKVAFSPDGRRLASAGDDRTVKVWDATTGEELLVLPDTQEVRCVAFRPGDGRWLVTGDTNGAVKVWDTVTRQVVRTLPRHTATVLGLAFSPDGRLLASAGEDKMVNISDATTGQLLHPLKGHERRVLNIAFSLDGQRLASGSFDTTVKVWDTSTGQEIQTLRGHQDPVTGVAFSPDGRRLASASFDMTVKLWDLTTGQATLTFRGHIHLVNGVAFLDDGRRLASASDDKTVKIWDATTGEVFLTLRGQTRELTGLACSPDGRRLASVSQDRTTKIWDATPVDAKAGAEALTLRGHTDQIWGLAFSPNGRRLASASWDATVRVWDLQTGLEDLAPFRKYIRVVFSVAFSPDGQRIASGSNQLADGDPSSLKVWDAMTGQEALHPHGMSTEAFDVAFSPDRRWLVTGDRKGDVTVWDATTGQVIHTLDPDGHGPQAYGLAFSPDGRRLASLSATGIVTVHDATRWHENFPRDPLLSFPTHKTWVRGSVAFSPNGQRIVVPGDGNTVNIWDVTTTSKPPSAPLLTLSGHTAQVWGVAFSPDGQWVATSGEDITVRIWNANTGALIRTFRGHTGIVTRVAFSPDGKSLASASFDKTVKVWDLTSLDKKFRE